MNLINDRLHNYLLEGSEDLYDPAALHAYSPCLRKADRNRVVFILQVICPGEDLYGQTGQQMLCSFMGNPEIIAVLTAELTAHYQGLNLALAELEFDLCHKC